jgi:hypothetical protein
MTPLSLIFGTRSSIVETNKFHIIASTQEASFLRQFCRRLLGFATSWVMFYKTAKPT